MNIGRDLRENQNLANSYEQKMRSNIFINHRFVCFLAFAILYLAAANLTAYQKTKPLPSFQEIVAHTIEVAKTFGDYQPGDMITREEASKLFRFYSRIGWEIPNQEQFLKSIPTQDEVVVEILHSEKGRKMMRQISKISTGFDCADQLSRLPDGERLLRQLTEGPDGYKMIEYLCNEKGGKEMGMMLNQASAKVDFRKPTGRIYTLKKLLTELAPVYEQATIATR
jgi:hypothetical protein